MEKELSQRIKDAFTEVENAEKKYKDAMKDIEKASSTLQQKQQDLHKLLQEEQSDNIKQSREIENLQEKAQAQVKKIAEKIKLDVGGVMFTTTKTTLLSQPNTLFSAVLQNGKPQEDGSYFLDRNPKHFELILDCLRTGKLSTEGMSKAQIEALEEEAKYYQVSLPSAIQPPIISKENQAEDIITSWLPKRKRIGGLIYKASRDGYKATDFHSRCDEKGPTLVVIKSKEGNIFGGYASASWNSQGGFIGASRSFLFTLINKQKIAPTKLPLKENRESGALFGFGSGGAQFGLDLSIYHDANIHGCHMFYPNYYEDPTEQGNALFYDTSGQATVQEIEVFKVM